MIYKNFFLDSSYWYYGLYYLGIGIYIDFIYNWMSIFLKE